MKVYPCGYASYPTLIAHLMEENPQLIMIDTRLTPWSPLPEWQGATLQRKYKERYRWGGKSLGNLNHAQPNAPIQLADKAVGLRGLRHWLQHGHDLLLLCGCALYDRCHLRVIVNDLRGVLPEVETIFPEQLTVPGMVKSLSVRQPWAWILTHPDVLTTCGIDPKTLENREWYPHYRGPLLIHAGVTVETSFFERRSGRLLPDYWEWKFGAAGKHLAQAMPSHRREYATRAIVGCAELVNVVKESESPWFMGSYGLELISARAITPIAYPGGRFLFDVPQQIAIDVYPKDAALHTKCCK